ncbi:MAG: hypothetical protein DI547_03435 [Sphingobium sp.]|nr:MAG: hypothetical protein DI547_03435 [Sphingobium sp.]
MNRFLAGGMGAMLLIAVGLFWWQSRAAGEQDVAPANPALSAAAATADEPLPEGDPEAVGDVPPMPPEATPQSREARRFGRYDRNRDGVVLRSEMMASRVKGFKALDTDGNNLLSFEEWAVATGERFAKADRDKDGKVTAAEFAASAPPPKPAPKCKC